MPSVLNQPLSSGATRSSAIWRLGLPLALFGILWADLIRQLSYEWSTNEQYAYGWFVPFFALALFWRRWMTRPGAGAGRLDHETTRPQDSSSVVHGPVVSSPVVRSPVVPVLIVRVLVVLLALCLLPIRVVHEINQDWPLFSWPLTLGVVCISLYAIFLLGGWTWARHFAFPVCFILVAVQWPYRIEHPLTQDLMRVVAGLTVELLGWFNIPAFQHGNLIELSTGVVGINEACSGIRSFQSSLMAALLMGELYRLRLLPRATLVLCGLTLGFCFNVVRTLLLSWQANAHGISAIDKWHDPAGMTIAVACFFALWIIAVLFQSRWRVAPDLRPLTSPREMTSSPISPGSLPRWFTLALSGWVALLLIGNEAWYRSHEVRHADTVRWWVSYPTNLPSFRASAVSKTAQRLLRYDAESGGAWDEPDGSKWEVYCFRWRGDNVVAQLSARNHRPEVCLPASGYELHDNLGLHFLPVNGLQLPFRQYVFDGSQGLVYVFFCLWEDEAEKQLGIRRPEYSDRLWPVFKGRRRLGQQTLELILSGYPSFEAAEQAVRKRLPDLIRIEDHQPGAITSGQ